MGTKVPTGAVCELLLLRQVKGDTWECLARPGKRMQPGTKVEFGDGSLTAVVDETMPDGNKYVTFTYDTETLYEKLDEFGKSRCPPYLTKQLEVRASTRPSMRRNWAALLRLRRACTLPRS